MLLVDLVLFLLAAYRDMRPYDISTAELGSAHCLPLVTQCARLDALLRFLAAANLQIRPTSAEAGALTCPEFLSPPKLSLGGLR
ncbi:hypothetical protein KKG66_06725, partial [bacterium]|nr:hypothetical protein [bacterium]